MFKIRLLLPQTQRYLYSQITTKQVEENILPSFTLSKERINEAIKLQPKLSKYTDNKLWSRSYETFINHGLSENDYFEIITLNPEIIIRDPKLIKENLELWRTCQFGEKYLFQLIRNYPHLLDIVDGNRLFKKITFLRSYVRSTKNVWKLLMNSPNLLNNHENVIDKKFKYLTNVMRIDIPEICKSNVFLKDLNEIKCRHVFLNRLGIFKVRSLKSAPNELSSNPKLFEIMDTNDKQFAKNIAKVSLIEYEIFKQLFERELQRNDDELENDLSDDENE